MIPTLLGRWQTRLVLFAIIGLPVTLLYAAYGSGGAIRPGPFVFLVALLSVGCAADIAYDQLQRFRWDADWPFVFQFYANIVEFLLVYCGFRYFIPLGIPGAGTPLNAAATHFAIVFIPSFLALLGGLQIFFVRWRFMGAEFRGSW